MASLIDIKTVDIHQDTIYLEQSEIQSLNTIPVELIPAPGENKIIDVVSAIVYLNYNGVNYSGTGRLDIRFVSALSTLEILITNGTAVTETFDRLAPFLNRFDGEQFVNDAVEIAGGSDYTGAGGTLTIDIVYFIRDI